MIKNKRLALAFAIIAAVFMNVALIIKTTSAISFEGATSQKIVNQSYAQGLYKCYTLSNGKSIAALLGSTGPSNDYGGKNGSTSDYQIAKTINEEDQIGFTYKMLFPYSLASNRIYVPNELTPEKNGDNNAAVNCANLVNGKNDNSSATDGFSNTIYERLGVSQSIYGISKTSNRSATDTFMSGMGYSGKANTSGGSACYAINYKYTTLYSDSTTYLYEKEGQANYQPSGSQSNSTSTKICAVTDANGKITKVTDDLVTGTVGHGGDYVLIWSDAGTVVRFELWSSKDEGGHGDCGSGLNKNCRTTIFFNKDGDEVLDYEDGRFDAKGMTLDTFKATLENRAQLLQYNTVHAAAPKYEGDNFKGELVGISGQSVTVVSSDTQGKKTWTLEGGKAAHAINFISEKSTLSSSVKAGSSHNGTALTESQKAVLYQYYIASPTLGNGIVRCDASSEEIKENTNWKKIEWFENANTKKNCYLTTYMSSGKKFSLVDASGFFSYQGSIDDLIGSLKYSISQLTGIDDDDIITSDDTQANVPGGDNSNGGTGTPATKEDCYTGAGSLGWIVCPIVYDVSGFIKDKYASWVEPALQINTLLFGSGGDNSTYNAWNIFRNIANIAFVAIFLIVILSQLTGFGLDNYGIKKILPKLILGAILINLSYVICQLAIDLANIVGYGVAGVFKYISSGINVPDDIKVEGVSVGKNSQEVGWLDGGLGLGLVVTLIVGVISVAAVLSQGTAIIIPILMAVLGVAISLFTLIAILGIRQAAAVLLVVASPLAFVAYMLPNTKKLFDKWFKALGGLLIAFPACSALIYGGDMVGRILLSTSNGSTWVLLSAAIVSVAPVFFIPRLIRGSMGAVANTATRLSSGLSRAGQRGINGSQFARDRRAASEAAIKYRRLMRRSGLQRNADGTVSNRQQGRFARAASDRARAIGGRIRSSGLGRVAGRVSAWASGTAVGQVVGDAAERAMGAAREGRDMRRDSIRNQAVSEVIARGQAGETLGDEGVERLNSKIYDAMGRKQDELVSGTERQIKLGRMTDASGAKIDPHSIDSLKKALKEAIISNDEKKIKALQNVMSGKGDNGREAVREAVTETEGRAEAASGLQTLAKNTMEQQYSQAYKENNRSMWDWAQATADPGSTSVKPLSGRAMDVKNAKENSLLNMDDHELERFVSSLGSSTATDEQFKQLRAMVIKALSSEAASGAKVERKAALQDMIGEIDKARPHLVPPPTPPSP